MTLEQVQLEGGPCDGWRHVVPDHQEVIVLNGYDGTEGGSGVYCYARSRAVPVVFEYDGFEPFKK